MRHSVPLRQPASTTAMNKFLEKKEYGAVAALERANAGTLFVKRFEGTEIVADPGEDSSGSLK